MINIYKCLLFNFGEVVLAECSQLWINPKKHNNNPINVVNNPSITNAEPSDSGELSVPLCTTGLLPEYVNNHIVNIIKPINDNVNPISVNLVPYILYH